MDEMTEDILQSLPARSLRAGIFSILERELGVDVVRPAIAGLMGAYGCALYARSMAKPGQKSTLLSRAEETKGQGTCRPWCSFCAIYLQKYLIAFSVDLI